MKQTLQYFLVILALAAGNVLNAQIGVNTPTPDETSILDLNTSERGLLIPRMTSQRRLDIINQIGQPAEGLLVYDTDEEMFYFYNPNNGDGDNTNGDQNWQAVNGLKLKDLRNNFQGSEYLKKLETHPSVQDISFFEATPSSATPPKLYVKGQVSIGASNTSPEETYGLYVDEKVQVTDDMKVDGKIEAGSIDAYGMVPVGGIIMWSTANGSIPANFRACTGGTYGSITIPNLADKFVLGAGGSYPNPGGNKSVTLTTSNMPSHSHTASTSSAGNHQHTQKNIYQWYNGFQGEDSDPKPLVNMEVSGNTSVFNGVVDSAGDHTHSVTVNPAGSGSAFDILPPYVALYYIIRVF